jgi:hypothetical protein
MLKMRRAGEKQKTRKLFVEKLMASGRETESRGV